MKASTRIITIAGGLAWISLTTAVLMSGTRGWLWWMSLVVFFAAWIVSRILGRDVAEKASGSVDEYESIQRYRARSIGYWASLVGGVVLVVVFGFFAVETRSGNPELLLLTPDLLMAGVLAVAALPTFVVAWTTRANDE